MSRRARQPQSILVTTAIIQGHFSHARFPGAAIFAANCRELSRNFRLSRGGAKLAAVVRLFAAVESRTRILHQLRHEQHQVVPYLIDIAGRSAAWLRAPEDFRPRTSHGKDQIAELVRHLFEAYRAPSWLNAVVAPRRGRPARATAFGWYVHVAAGRSLRSAPELPLELSRRAAHEALRAPARSTPRQALLHGYLRGHGAPGDVRDAVLQATRWDPAALAAPWLKLFEKIARTPRFPAAQVQPLIRYAQARHAEGGSLDVSVAALLRGLERWQTALREAAVRRQAEQLGPQFEARWAACPLGERFAGSTEQGDFIIDELRSLRELFEEGQRMQHCVYTYAPAARAGTLSIWSLRVTRAGREIGRVTVRVVTSEGVIVEARRRSNHAIAEHERELLRAWATSRGWSLAAGV